MAEPQILKHADHDPSLICRPALGNGLCEPLPLPQSLRESIEVVLLDHADELDGDSVDANLAELAYVYRSLTGWTVGHEVAAW